MSDEGKEVGESWLEAMMEVATRSCAVTGCSALLEGCIRLVQSKSQEPVVDIISCDTFHVVRGHTASGDRQLTVPREPGQLCLDSVEL